MDPKTYGIWCGDGWLEDVDGHLFWFPSRGVAEAQIARNPEAVRAGYVRIIAEFGPDGKPVLPSAMIGG